VDGSPGADEEKKTVGKKDSVEKWRGTEGGGDVSIQNYVKGKGRGEKRNTV